MTITLYTADGLSETFDNSHEDLTTKGHFVKADVSAGTWILYTYADYNNAQNGGSPSNYKVLKAGDTDETIATVNGSLYLVAKATEGYILFDHVYYGGKRKAFRTDCPNVSQALPNISGVSSAINLSHDEEFEIFTKIDYKGPKGKLEVNKWYPTPSDMGFPNDALQSIRKA